jgi:glyoxylase-like metal-dependent hydrolase (beta-lactamase superfamily II)
MSLDNTSHPGRPGLDELVPSRYALRVGEIDVLVVSDGVLSLPEAMLGHNVDPAVRATWLEDMFLPPDVLEWALNAVVVRSGRRTILIDAGMGMEFPDLPRVGKLAKRLEAAGIDPALVTDVVLTHMHMDHCGGLLADGVKERLHPDLRIYVAAAEAEFWEAPDFSRVSMPPGFPDALRRTGKRFLKEFSGQLRTFENEYEVAPGVVVQRTGGHTPGHSVVRLASGGDRLTFAGDAVFQVGFEHPDWYNGFEHDPRGGSPRPGPSFAGAGGEPRIAGGHSPVLPVRLPRGSRRRRLSMGTRPLGVLTDRCLVQHRPYLLD